MAIFSERIPDRGVMSAVFVACIIPVQFWSIFNVLREIPAWILRMSIWEMLGVIAYTQVFAFFEAVVLALLIFIAAFILPGKLLRDDLAVSSTVIMLVLTVWLIILHYNSNWIEAREVRALALWGISFIAALSFSLWAAKKWQPVSSSIGQVNSRFTVLAGLFLIIDAISVVIILVRNLDF